MCLFSKPDYDVEFANRERPRRRTKVVTSYAPERRTERISETVIHERPAQYVQAPRSSAPIIVRPATPPARLELISVEERRGSSPRNSRVSVSGGKGRSREDTYIEREREIVRMSPPQPDYDTYRYVEAPKSNDQDTSRSRTYQSNPRHSGRLVERERVVIEDSHSGRRREYYRKP